MKIENPPDGEGRVPFQKPKKGEEVVVTGISGTFPNCTNVQTFRDNIFNKIDLVTGDNKRWKFSNRLTDRYGKVLDTEKFDSGFFGVTSLQSDNMDPMVRKILEKSVEAIMDAGYHPSDLIGTNTAVISGLSWGETEKYVFFDNQIHSSDPITGAQRSATSKWISYHLQLSGNCYTVDTASSSSIFALEDAYTLLKNGLCDKVLVCGANLCLNPKFTLQFLRLGVLSPDGVCRSFDDAANGYVRSEAIAAILMERRNDAKRVYAEVLHAITNCNGFHENGITFPSTSAQKVLFTDCVNKAKIDPTSFTYIEAHGTGTRAGDPEELKAIDDVYCTGRDKPLHIGGVKTNIGHSEASSGLCSLIKVIIIMETGYIPATIHYKTPRKGVEALDKGRMVVVTETLPVPDNRGLFGVNNIGFGGANGTMILFWNTKCKINDGQPNDDLPRLLCVSSRTEEGVHAILDDFKKCDAEYAYLIHQIFRKRFENHLYRGFGIYSKKGVLQQSLAKVEIKGKKLYLVFSNYNTEFLKLGDQLMTLPIFAKTIESIHNILLKSVGINFLEIYKNPMKLNIMHQILIAVSTQIGLVDLLKGIHLIPYRIVGVGSGEIIAAYADDCLTLEQTILTLFYIASDTNNSNHKDLHILEKTTCLRKNDNEKWIPMHEQKPKQSLTQYLIDNILNTTNGRDLKNLFIENAISLIIGTKMKNMLETKSMYLVDPNSKNFVQDILSNLGKFYEYGFDMQLDKLYPTIELPVSRGTPMLSPLIKWNYNRDSNVYLGKDELELKSGQNTIYISPKMEKWNFIVGHVIDGRNLFPATGYLYLVWETFAEMMGKELSEMKIVFEDVKLLRATNITNEDTLELLVMIQSYSHTFEIMEGGALIATGKVFEKSSEQTFWNLQTQSFKDEDLCLKQADAYKELQLRRYYYSGLFRSIQRSNVDATQITVEWKGNWIAFMDCLLQSITLQMDTRNIYLPIGISQLIIDAPKHLNIVTKQSTVSVETDRTMGILRAGGIELRSLKAISTTRKRARNPVLEVYKFIANESECNVDDSVRVLLQFVLENSDTMKFKVVEVCPEEMDQDQLLCPLVQEILKDIPLVQQELLVLSNKPMKLSNITVQSKSLKMTTDCFILIVPNLLESTELSVVLDAIKDVKGFIVSREKLSVDLTKFNQSLEVLCVHKTNKEALVLLKPMQKYLKETITIDITNATENFQWMAKLQDLLKEHDKIIIYAQGDEISGILGLANCLKREHYGDKLNTVFIMDKAPKFDPNLDFYKKQLDKNLFINVWKDGTWGTYRHLELPQTQIVQKEHCYANITARGDLSTMTWFEGNLNENEPIVPEKELIHIYYSALNFRDLMTASGKIPSEVVTNNRIEQEYIQGIEFSGRDSRGRRIMGMCPSGSLATHIQTDKGFIYPIPDNWTMEEAATVPMVYATVVKALCANSRLETGQSILIHSGTGGVGQAAINLSLYFGLTVFVTVGTQEKRDFIKRHYPQIKEKHIGNSRDTSFELMIRKSTSGRGVDYVLNSLAEEKLLASVRCLAKGGKFIEIGKFDIVNDNELNLYLLEKGSLFTSLSTDRFTQTANDNEKRDFYEQFIGLTKRGAIRPLPRTVFPSDETEKAFRYMGQGKHIGKVLVKIRDEEAQQICPSPRSTFKSVSRFYCNPACSYLILGGLGGFGMELADFLVVRGARKLVLSSRSGISNGYQQYRIRIWESYGVEVLISTCDILTEKGCTELLKLTEGLGSVDGIFNLAVVLRDGIFDNQTIDDFETVFSAKVSSTKCLDRTSRKLCPNLKYFVVFSSLTSGKGNAGQTNYGMANSIMERICERRRREGYPALAIQWGAIGDVGLLAKELQDGKDEKVIGGTLQQGIFSCLQVLDKFLTQEQTIVSSMLVAEIKFGSKASNPVDAILNILGIASINTISMFSTLPELGMDSIMTIEIKQVLEQDYKIFLKGQDIKALTLSKLKNLYDAQEIQTAVKVENETDIPLNIELLFPYIGSEENANIPLLKLKTLVEDGESAPQIFALPGLEGTATLLEPLCKKLKAHVSCLQYCTGNKMKNISEMAESLITYVMSFNGDLIILAHSFGCIIATELLHLLQLADRRVTVIYLDGSPDLLRDFAMQNFSLDDENLFQTKWLMFLMTPYMTYEQIMKHKKNILQHKGVEKKLDYVISLLDEVKVSKCFKEICLSIYNRTLTLYEYKPKMDKLKFPITLFKSTEPISIGAASDYNLSSLFENHIEVHNIKGNHVTMLENDDLASEINKICGNVW